MPRPASPGPRRAGVGPRRASLDGAGAQPSGFITSCCAWWQVPTRAGGSSQQWPVAAGVRRWPGAGCGSGRRSSRRGRLSRRRDAIWSPRGAGEDSFAAADDARTARSLTRTVRRRALRPRRHGGTPALLGGAAEASFAALRSGPQRVQRTDRSAPGSHARAGGSARQEAAGWPSAGAQARPAGDCPSPHGRCTAGAAPKRGPRAPRGAARCGASRRAFLGRLP